jgi:small subunit ribosomal protein S20
VRSQVRSTLKDARASQGAEQKTSIAEAIRSLDRAVSKGVIHRNTAARKKSALARRLATA